jgi:hypothetical protein
MVELAISPDEVRTGIILPEHLSQARSALQQDGIVILKDVVEVAHLEFLHERMRSDLETILNRPDVPFQFNTGNVQQDPPPFPPYLFRDILVNPIVVAVTKSILGPGLKNTFYSGNTALPGGTRQPVHSDTNHLWPDLEVAHPAHMLVVNVPVVDMDARNGSTEIWPGTHLDTTMGAQMSTIQVPVEALDRRRAVVPPLQPTVKRGSVVIRDMRLWHAGMPNLTDQARPMIAMIHIVRWLPSGKMTFAKGSEEFLADSDLVTPAEFVDGPIDYLHHHTSYDFNPEERAD